MRIWIVPMAALALVACNKKDAATADAANAGMATDAMAANTMAANDMMAPAAASMNNTTYEYVRNSRAIQLSVDGTGNYISTAGKDHMDHGTTAMKDGKLCFTSAMNKDGEVCWTDPKLAVGQQGPTVSDKGEKLNVKLVAYVPKAM